MPDYKWREAPVLHAASAEEAGMDSVFLFRTIDSLVRCAIEMRAFPGCQLFVARDGKVVIDRSYGHHDYSCAAAVENDHLYDLASVTKMAASTLATMKLVETGHLDLDDRFSKHYPPFRGTDKRYITFREVLAHRSGLPAGVPMLRRMKSDADSLEVQKKSANRRYKKKKWDELAYNDDCFADHRGVGHSIEIAHDLYLHHKYRDTLLNAITAIPLRSRTYRYSDLPFILFPQVVHHASGHDFEKFLADEFYRPLGVGLVFNPLNPAHHPQPTPLEKIVPTETDDYFRGTKKQDLTVRGYVHDESAAIMGGVSGNAGLFGTARDLGVVMQMLLNGGTYDGRRYLRPGTVAEFTRQQYPFADNRRGLGFDRPLPGNDTLAFKDAYPAPGVSASSFGHPGFTGCFVWADPEYGLVYVLMCNRVTPSRDNRAFVDMRIRYAIQQAVYDAIKRFDEGDKAGLSTADGNPPRE